MNPLIGKDVEVWFDTGISFRGSNRVDKRNGVFTNIKDGFVFFTNSGKEHIIPIERIIIINGTG